MGIPQNIKPHRISLPEFGLAFPLVCSLPREEILDRLQQQPDLECFESTTLVFDEDRRLTIDDLEDLRRPSKDLAARLMDEVFRHFCTGTYWWFGGVLTLLETRGLGGPEIELDDENFIQLLAVLATLHDTNSKPVMLFSAGMLV
jgi:hypothetical protein